MAYWGLAMSELPNPLVPPFPRANLKAGSEAIQQGKAAKTETPREAAYLAAIEVFHTDYDNVNHKTRAERYEQAMQRLHENYPDDPEAAIFYALALNGAVDFDDKTYSKQLKAAAILNVEAKKQPNHPGIAHYLIHSYDFAPLAAMCVSTAQLYGKIAPSAPHALHMPSHIYSMLGMWDESIRSNLASEGAAEAYGLPVAHQLDFLVYAYLQRAEDGPAKNVIDSMVPISVGLGTDTALAAIPARFAWAGQTRIQKQAALAWVIFSEGQRDVAIAAMRQAADLDDASEKNVGTSWCRSVRCWANYTWRQV